MCLTIAAARVDLVGFFVFATFAGSVNLLAVRERVAALCGLDFVLLRVIGATLALRLGYRSKERGDRAL